MIYLKNFILVFLSVFSFEINATQMPDQFAQVIYVPTISINPDENNRSFPPSQMVKLFISKEGKVVKVFYANNTNKEIKQKIDKAMNNASFTPYLKAGVPVQSIVPYIVNFYYLTEEEYRGH